MNLQDIPPGGRALLGNRFEAGIGMADRELDLWGRPRSLNEAALQTWLAADATSCAGRYRWRPRRTSST